MRHWRGGVTRMKSAPSSTSAPSLRNSQAIAAMRSVSLTRQLAMLLSVVVPFAYSAITASVMAASGMWLQSRLMAWSGQAPREMRRVLGVLSICAPIIRAASTKRMSPWMDSAPTPTISMPFWSAVGAAIAPSAMK